MDFDKAFNISSIQLEPRLQEYIRRKRFNEENYIDPTLPEEKDFCITGHDLKIIKRHSQGKTKLYTSKRLAKDPHFVKPDNNDFEESNNNFKKDPRYQRLVRKAQSHKDAQKQIRNFEGIDEDYTIFHESSPNLDLINESSSYNVSKPYDDPLNQNSDFISDDRIMIDSRDLVLAPTRPVKASNRVGSRSNTRDDDNAYIKNRPARMQDINNNRSQYCYNPNQKSKNESSYHHTPKITYHQRLTQDREMVNGGLEHSRNVSDIIGNLDSYNKHLNNTYDYVQPDADLDTKTFTSGVRTNTRRENTSSYQSVPYGYGKGLQNVSLEDSLRGGMRDSSRKTTGFKNPFEHHFDYISDDISDSRHTVQMWPQSTRGQDKEIARPNSVAIKSAQRMRNLERK